MASFFLFEGDIDPQSYDHFFLGYNIENTVFIFPGNEEHHGPDVSLVSKKDGEGLAKATASIFDSQNKNNSCFPSLSFMNTYYNGSTLTFDLPKSFNDEPINAKYFGTLDKITKKVKGQITGKKIPDICKNAVLDLWIAIGAGYDVCLPVRKFKNYFFSKPLKGTKKLEPSFGGDNNKVRQPKLYDFYRRHIEIMRSFLGKSDADQNQDSLETILEYEEDFSPEFKSLIIENFVNGKNNSKSDWFTAKNGLKTQGTPKPGVRDLKGCVAVSSGSSYSYLIPIVLFGIFLASSVVAAALMIAMFAIWSAPLYLLIPAICSAFIGIASLAGFSCYTFFSGNCCFCLPHGEVKPSTEYENLLAQKQKQPQVTNLFGGPKNENTDLEEYRETNLENPKQPDSFGLNQ